MFHRAALPFLAAGFASHLLAAEPEVDSAQLPRVPATPPEQAVSTFKVKPGFRIELVAAEPLVVDPIAMSFDEDGRCYVVEMVGSSRVDLQACKLEYSIVSPK